MKWRELIRDKVFMLYACFYLFLTVFVLQMQSSVPLEEFPQDNLFHSFNYFWYNDPWVLAVFTAVLILFVATFGTEKAKPATKKH